jgi:hypothetical protein
VRQGDNTAFFPHTLRGRFTIKLGFFDSGDGFVNVGALLDHAREDQPGQQKRDLWRLANACKGLWRELFTRARFLIGQSYKQGD